jgi:pimeloyl-ACP methyl ester carboxylesterase
MSFIRTDDDCEIYYETNGEEGKPVVLFVSGYMGIADIWRPVMQKLGSEYFCIAYDIRGYGRSSKPEIFEEYSMDRVAQDMATILEALQITKPVLLVTHSFGNYIAASFYLKKPELVAGMIYTGSAFDELPAIDPDEFLRTAAENGDVPSKAVEWYTRLGLNRAVALEAAKWSPQALKKFARQGVYFKLGAKWRDINIPTLVVHGDRDVVCSVDGFARPLAESLPKSGLKVLKGVNHFPPTEAPEEVANLIASFAKSLKLEPVFPRSAYLH